jgi:hypothetical protein
MVQSYHVFSQNGNDAENTLNRLVLAEAFRSALSGEGKNR